MNETMDEPKILEQNNTGQDSTQGEVWPPPIEQEAPAPTKPKRPVNIEVAVIIGLVVGFVLPWLCAIVFATLANLAGVRGLSGTRLAADMSGLVSYVGFGLLGYALRKRFARYIISYLVICGFMALSFIPGLMGRN